MLRLGWCACLLVLSAGCNEPADSSNLRDDSFSPALFANPPAEFRPQTRWWWPGASVEDSTLREHLRQLEEVGYGAVEIQPFMSALTHADLTEDERIRAVGDARFLEQLRAAGCAAQERGLDWDITFGSGWSTGGVGIEDDGARQLIAGELTLEGPMTYSGLLPKATPPAWIGATNNVLLAIDGFDEAVELRSVLGAEVIEEPDDPPATIGDVIDLSSLVEDGTITWEVPAGMHRLFAVYENRTQHFPAGGAYPGALEDARIIDHLDRRGVEGFLGAEFGAWMDAVADCPPRAVFVDSFELVGELPWTTNFGSSFEASFGYDLEPLLPFLFLEGGESEYVNILRRQIPPRYQGSDDRGARAREDYEAFRSARFAGELVGTLHSWLQSEGVDLRLQAHGGYGDALDTYALAEVPEAEGLYAGGSYDFLRLAASAAHSAGRRYVSNETLVSIGKLELSEEEARLVIGRAFSAGINRLVHHGNAYPYLHQDGQRWFPFHPLADSAFTTGPVDLSFDIRPGAAIWEALPALNRMSARLSYALSRGSSAPEVAWLYPHWEVSNFPNGGIVPGAFESETSKSLRRAGFSYDRISRAGLAASSSESGVLSVGEGAYSALLVEGSEAASPEMLEGVQRAVDAGVTVVWVGGFPARAEGLVDAARRDASVAALVESLRTAVVAVASAEEIPVALRDAGLTPSLGPVDASGIELSVERRLVDGGDLYFLFNESFEPRTEALRVEDPFAELVLLDPETGRSQPANLEGDVLTVTLPGARGTVLWVRRGD